MKKSIEKIQHAQIAIFYNEQYPNGYTTANEQLEALEVARVLVERTHVSWVVIGGSSHWKTLKPAYWVIYTNEKINRENLTFEKCLTN